MEDDLVASGRFVRIETRGERSGRTRAVTVGFVDDDPGAEGAVLVAAGSADTAWARNLLADPTCRVRIGERARSMPSPNRSSRPTTPGRSAS